MITLGDSLTAAGLPAVIAGEIGIEWPKDGGSPGPNVLRGIPGWRVTFFDGAGPVCTVRQMTLHVSAEGSVWADLIMFTDADGRPVMHSQDEGGPLALNIGDNGQPTEGRFAFLVTHMRVR